MTNTTNPLIQRAFKAQRLSRDEERELLARWQQDRDQKAAERMVECNLRHVVSVAFSFRRYDVPQDVLIAEGNLGLVKALSRFDLTKDVRFSTYATYWIRSYVIDHVLRNWSVVGGGSGALKTRLFFRLRREAARAWTLCGDGLAADELVAQRMQLPLAKVLKMKQQIERRDVSLARPVGEEGSATLLDTLAGDDDGPEQIERAELVTKIRPALGRALKQLSARERFIVESRLMADREDALSLSQIASRFGISRERVRQIEGRIKEKLRCQLSAEWSGEELAAA